MLPWAELASGVPVNAQLCLLLSAQQTLAAFRWSVEKCSREPWKGLTYFDS